MRDLFLITGVVLAFLLSSPVSAFESYYTHWWTPYPPSCVFTLTLPRDTVTLGDAQLLVSETISLSSDDTTAKPIEVEIEVIRRSCVEENRSAVFLLFKNPTGSFRAPRISARVDDKTYALRLVKEPNTRFDDYSTKTISKDVAFFLIDGASFNEHELDRAITADQYNDAFHLIIGDTGSSGFEYQFDLAANNPLLKPRRKLLTGRMSGLWIAEDTTDQGFQLSINELWVGESPMPQAFLTWYTFDKDGNPLWLAGDGTFGVMGDSHVTLHMVLVENGEFLGNKKADRQRLHDAVLIVESCNRLRLNYDLEEIGLGKGGIWLKRIFSLETAGFACRDYQSRIDTLAD